MAELGYEEGKNFSFEYVQAVNVAGLEAAYQELASRNVDILLAGGSEIGLKFALAAAGTRPIVMVAIDYDPLAGGYVRSLARPGVNLTGIPKSVCRSRVGIPGCAGDRRVLGRNLRRTMACRGERCSETRLAACRRSGAAIDVAAGDADRSGLPAKRRCLPGPPSRPPERPAPMPGARQGDARPGPLWRFRRPCPPRRRSIPVP